MMKIERLCVYLLASALRLADDFSRALASQSPPVVSNGLRNLGNTCYLNAQLQCAFHIPKIREIVLNPPKAVEVEDPTSNEGSSESEEDETALSNEERSLPPEESQGLLALRHVFTDMLQSASASVPVSPRVLTVTLGIPVLEQQDSQEFWKLLLPALQKPELTRLYSGSLEDYIVAMDDSGRERRREEAYLDLSLDLSTDGGRSSLQRSLEKQFGESEILSVAEGNGWRPEKGAEKVDAQKGYSLLQKSLPSILQLHLKRFNYDWNRDVMEKVNDPVDFPLNLDLSKVAKGSEEGLEAPLYDLQSVVIHMGEFGVGHYYAYVRPDVRSNIWYRFNDDVVTEVTFAEVVADATGGKVCGSASKKGIFGKLIGIFQGPSFGYGGRTSNAYVLQYVRRADIPNLYCLHS